MSDSTADTALPPFLRQFFWDTDFNQLRLPAQEFYCVERLLESGDDAAVRWLRQTFSAENIARVVRESRAISRKTPRQIPGNRKWFPAEGTGVRWSGYLRSLGAAKTEIRTPDPSLGCCRRLH